LVVTALKKHNIIKLFINENTKARRHQITKGIKVLKNLVPLCLGGKLYLNTYNIDSPIIILI